MRRMTVVSLALLVTTAGLARADGLGDAAKRAKAKRGETKKSEPAVVHTNDSILAETGELEKPTRGTFNAPSVGPKAAAPAPAASAPSGPGTRPSTFGGQVGLSEENGGAPPPARAGRTPERDSDAEKRDLAADYKRRLVPIDERIRAAEAELRAAEEHWKFVDSHMSDSSQEAVSRLDRAVEAVTRARAERSAIEDEARRQGIPPGWIR